MIAKRIDIEPENDNYRALAEYLSAANDKDEKLDALWIENCDAGDTIEDLELAIREVMATQAQNQRAKAGKTYHLMISFRDERPDPEALRDIEKQFAKALGFDKHQRIAATHVNTDNFHMHIAFNKIHPGTLKAHTPHRDFQTLEKTCRAMEQKHGLKIDIGRSDKQEKDQRPTRSRDMEAHTWEQSFDGYVRENKVDLMDALSQVTDWQDLHRALDQYSLELRRHGDGLVIANSKGAHRIKASSLDRAFAMQALEKRFGSFRAPLRTQEIGDRGEGAGAPAHPDVVGYTRDHRDELLYALGKAKSWQDVHQVMAQHGLQARLRGNGLVIASRNIAMTASSLDRSLSKAALEKRLGPFQVPARSLQQQAGQLARPRALRRQQQGLSGRPGTYTAGQSLLQAKRRTQYRRRPITRHPGQAKLWRRYLAGHRKRSSLVVQAFKTWKEFLMYQAVNDPLALAIIVAQRKIMQALNPLPSRSRSPGIDR